MTSIQHFYSASTHEIMDSPETSSNTLPQSWYSSREMYEFERRAIFSKTWLLMSHKSRLAQTGDWLRYSFASYDIIITRDRTGTINSFHNVCRHRAYPVIEKKGAGNSKILACRYHGWSYGLNGKLAKAPGYQEMNLDKDQNSLFRCHTQIDADGFIWINIDARDEPEKPFQEHLSKINAHNDYSEINLEDYTFDAELTSKDLNFNWKNATIDATHKVIKERNTSSSFYFPNASTTISAKCLVIQKILPQASNKTTKHYELYRHKDCSDDEWKVISDTYTSAAREENTPQVPHVSVQAFVLDAIKEHYKQEKILGRQIWPSRPAALEPADQTDEDEEVCAGLACGPQKEVLVW